MAKSRSESVAVSPLRVGWARGVMELTRRIRPGEESKMPGPGIRSILFVIARSTATKQS